MPSCVDSRIAAVPASAPSPSLKGPPSLPRLRPSLSPSPSSPKNAKSPGHSVK